MGGGVCDFCGRRGGTLVSVCNCYKKHEDRGRVHLECFKARALELSRVRLIFLFPKPVHIFSRANLLIQCDTTRRPRVCAQCGAEYRLAWSSEFQFVWKRFLSGRSLGIFCQLLMIIVTLLGTLSSLFSVYVHTNSGDDTERESAGKFLR